MPSFKGKLMLNQLSKKVADYLGLDEIPIEFGKIEDDSILITKGIPKIVINEKYNGNYLECAKSITHEYRHAFQIYWIAVMSDDPLAKIWKEELSRVVNTTTDEYECQAIEIDAFAFTQTYLGREGIQAYNEVKEEMYEYLLEQNAKKLQKSNSCTNFYIVLIYKCGL
ncbi:MAG: hypothetical protein WCR33_01930 [Bacilli bacterium]